MSDDRTDSYEPAELPNFDIPGSAPVKRIKRELQSEFDNAYLKLCDGKKFTHEQQTKVVETVLAGHDLNRYRREIATRIAISDRQQRHAAFGKAMAHMARGQFDMFTRDMARRVWMGTDEKNTEVALIDAKWNDLQHKLIEQRDDIAKKVHTIELTETNCKVLEPVMKDDPECSFGDALERLGMWLPQ